MEKITIKNQSSSLSTVSPSTEKTRDVLEWMAYEHEYAEKNTDWFWAVGIITVALAITAILLDNLLFGILIVIGAFTLVIQSVKKPKEILHKITNDGILVGSILYKYTSLESFWINKEEKKIILKSKKLIVPYIVLPIDKNISEEQLHNKLSIHLKVEEMNEPLAQKIMERLGF